MSDEIVLLSHKVDTINSAVIDVKATLKELTNAITKLTLIEERQNHAAMALERVFKSIESIDERLSAVEVEAPANKKMSVWIDRATWAGMGLLAMLLFKKSGLL